MTVILVTVVAVDRHRRGRQASTRPANIGSAPNKTGQAFADASGPMCVALPKATKAPDLYCTG